MPGEKVFLDRLQQANEVFPSQKLSILPVSEIVGAKTGMMTMELVN